MLTIVDDKLMVAHPIPGGYSFTLASRLGQLINRAEAAYGPRDRSYTILGVEFREGVPQVWFPADCNHVVIQLGHTALQDPTQALFQLAHECIHLLDPRSGGSNRLEEGLATVFSIDYLADELHVRDYHPTDPRYVTAASLVRELLAVHSDGPKLIREHHGALGRATAEQIRGICPKLSPETAPKLAEPL